MPVPLPPRPAGINLPAQPQDPPTLADVVAARHFQAQVDVAVASQTPNGPNEEDAAQADIYKTNVIVANAAGVAPAWFQPAMAAILAPIRQTVAQIRNHQLYDDGQTEFTIVPFNDGSMPTEDHHLPALLNAAAIKALTAQESSAYVNGYGLGNIGRAPARRAAIGRVVGCTVKI